MTPITWNFFSVVEVVRLDPPGTPPSVVQAKLNDTFICVDESSYVKLHCEVSYFGSRASFH